MRIYVFALQTDFWAPSPFLAVIAKGCAGQSHQTTRFEAFAELWEAISWQPAATGTVPLTVMRTVPLTAAGPAFWPADVAAGIVGGAVGTAGAIAAAPFGAGPYV
jgi:hypothetical protein